MSDLYLELYGPNVYRIKDGEGNVLQDSLSKFDAIPTLESMIKPKMEKAPKQKTPKKAKKEEKENDERPEERTEERNLDD